MQAEVVNGLKIKVFDSGEGKTSDRYTIVYMDEFFDGCFLSFCMNERPSHPCYGIGMHSQCVIGEHLGKRIAFSELPEECRECFCGMTA